MDESGYTDVVSSLLYVDQELQVLGFPTLTSTVAVVEDIDVKDKIVSVLLKLVCLHRKNVRTMEELRESWSKDKSDVVIQREAQARLKEDLKLGEKELALLEDRERQLSRKMKILNSKLKAEQDEVRKLKSNMQYKETQRIHENKKREKELERIKEKLVQVQLSFLSALARLAKIVKRNIIKMQLVTDRNHERRLGVSMLNALQRGEGKRKTWTKPGSKDEEMYQSIISSYEERQKELMLENSSLRESLAGMEKQLVELLNEKQAVLRRDKSQESELTEAMGDKKSISSGHFQMPYDIVREGIEKSVREKCHLLKDKIAELKLKIEALEDESDVSGDHTSEEVRKLEHQLSDYKGIISQQEKMLQRNSAEREKIDLATSRTSYSDHNLELKLIKEAECIKEQKEYLNKERQRNLEAACKLDYEKKKFEEQKLSFYQDKVNVSHSSQELDSFFNKLCSTPAKTSEPLLSKYLTPSGEADVTNVSGVSASVLQDSINCEVDLKQDLSMCSDDGMLVLNERPDHTTIHVSSTNSFK